MRRAFDSSQVMRLKQKEICEDIKQADHQIEKLNEIIYEYGSDNAAIERRKIKETLVSQNQFFSQEGRNNNRVQKILGLSDRRYQLEKVNNQIMGQPSRSKKEVLKQAFSSRNFKEFTNRSSVEKFKAKTKGRSKESWISVELGERQALGPLKKYSSEGLIQRVKEITSHRQKVWENMKKHRLQENPPSTQVNTQLETHADNISKYSFITRKSNLPLKSYVIKP